MKVIDKCRSLCDKEKERLQAKIDDARDCYNDTGYNRYYNSMVKYEEELEELYQFINGSDIAKAEANRYKRLYNELNDKLYYIRKMTLNLTDDDFTSPRVNEILNQLARLG